MAPFRWWDGRVWTANLAIPNATRRPRLPAWLSVPVLVGGLLLIPFVAYAVATTPVVLLLSLVPVAIVGPVLLWLDRVEPEPRASRLHAFLWGATIAILVAGTVNSLVAVFVSEAAAAVISAPLVEETMKGLAVVWAVRRREVDGVVDGLVYAGWAGLGFAVVEDIEYLLVASEDGVLAETFLVRALVTPFAHPLFTAWIGLAIGLAVAKGRRIFPTALWGWALAVALHAGWNGSLVAAVAFGSEAIIALAALVFLAIFIGSIVMVVAVRRREKRRLVEALPMLAMRYHLSPHEVQIYVDWTHLLAARRSLPRRHRRQFDDVHAALSRLAALHARPGVIDRADEERLVTQLQHARRAFAAG
jgi:RsiW-degrading membrane proteinase PrsW (M82 family)